MALPALPPAEDDQVRRARDLERAGQEQAAARSAEKTTIGAGGLVVKDGGSIRVEAPGTIDLPGGAFSANSLTAATTIAAGDTISTPANVQGGGLVSTGAASIAGSMTVGGTVVAGAVSATGEVSGNHATFPGGINSVDVYNRLLTYGGGYKNQYIHIDGNQGYVPSSRQFKQDIEEWKFDPSIVSYLRVVTFRYIAAVENLGDEAEQELGLIAEELFELGYHWLVDYEVRYTEKGARVPVPFQGEVESIPFGVKYERICLILLSWAQSIELRLEAAGI
ncbi:tail fiber domain-containing protein [Agromyces ramosus]|uniref:Cytoskeletal protein CcmA (Bactofilin family) n=1 Tax=Agromyces ramosus TaxID=33879 RepID=A0ABU0R9H6_9MICO|nr:tail fiber domain-containing protein [Agromyces ramosus]MDQ0894417.1 cytoskeletal protein CcmA (bactofilin family) [Agromyces ramosus]